MELKRIDKDALVTWFETSGWTPSNYTYISNCSNQCCLLGALYIISEEDTEYPGRWEMCSALVKEGFSPEYIEDLENGFNGEDVGMTVGIEDGLAMREVLKM